LTAHLFKFHTLFHSLSKGSFQTFPHGTLRYRLVKRYLSLEGGPPFFKQPFRRFTHYCFGLFSDTHFCFIFSAILPKP